jgi:Cytochrome P460
MRSTLLTAICLVIVISVLALHPATGQQGSGSSRIEPQGTAKAKTPEEFYQSFWTYLSRKDAPYTKWPVLPGKEGVREGEGPHGKFVKTYVNKLVADSPKALPLGGILIAENYGEDQVALKNVMVMYRVKGADPQHFDWYWLAYQPDGTIARSSAQEGNKPIAGKVASCIECHAKAKGADFVFSNDEAATEAR